MGRCLIFYCLLIFSTQSLFSQKLSFVNYTVQDGLVSNAVRKIFQDSKGFMWIATWEGLSKYDGHKFTNFSMSNGLSFNLINDLYEDPGGKLYVAQNDGSVDIIENDRILKNPFGNKVVVNHFFPLNEQQVYVGTDGKGLYELVNGKLLPRRMQQPQSISGFAPLNDSLSIICSESDFGILDRDLDRFTLSMGSNSGYNKVYRDSKNRIWLCTAAGLKLVATEQKKNTPINFLPLPAPFNNPVLQRTIFNLFEDRSGNFWISTEMGLLKIEEKGRLNIQNKALGLATNIITSIYEDREKNIWYGTQQGLVKLVTRNDILTFSLSDGLVSDEVQDVIPLDNNHVLVVGQSFQKINTADFTISTLDRSLSTLQAKRPETAGQLLLHRSNFFQQSNYFCSAVDVRGNIFLGTGNGIVSNSAKLSGDIPLYRVTSLVFDKQGWLWVGTWQKGLYRLRPHYEPGGIRFTSTDFSHLIPDQSIRSSFVDSKGHIWFGTRYNGAVRLKQNTSGNYSVLHWNNTDRLTSNWVRAFAEDKQGNIWIGTYSGINKLKPSDNRYEVVNFSRMNNLFRSINVIYIDPEGVFWCGGYPGLVRFRDDQADTLTAYPVAITSVHAGKPEDSLYFSDINKKLSLAHDHNLVQFEFSSPSFINEKEVLYSYRLDGSNDTTWSRPSNQHSVLFASLRPGSYRFEVRAQGWNGNWGAATSYPFIIRPPFWMTWWFISICVALLIFFLIAVYRYRINQLIKIQRVRNRIATDLHDDIGSTLTNISILSELSHKNLQQPQEAKKFLQRISEEVTTSGQALDDIIWSVNSVNDTMEETFARMRRYAADLFDSSETHYELQFHAEFSERKMNMEQRRDVYLMFKESLNNIHKHASAKNVWVKAGLKNHNFEMMIRDDGKGFDTGQSSHRHGLKNLYYRVEKWKGKLTIRSKPGMGTRIDVLLPFLRS